MLSGIYDANFSFKSTISKYALKWYAIYTKSRFEKKLQVALHRNGFESFLPLIKVKRKWSDRDKIVKVPLLPGYVFVKAMPDMFSKIYSLPGFVRFVTFDGNPSIIKESELKLLKLIISNGNNVQKTISCNVGDYVRINSGPFSGWEGFVARKVGKNRIIFQLESIRQLISVEVEITELEISK